jgi:hypothetical protein
MKVNSVGSARTSATPRARSSSLALELAPPFPRAREISRRVLDDGARDEDVRGTRAVVDVVVVVVVVAHPAALVDAMVRVSSSLSGGRLPPSRASRSCRSRARSPRMTRRA